MPPIWPFAELGGQDFVELLASGKGPTSLAEAFTRAFPAGFPLPAYLRQLLLTNDPAGAALFTRWRAATRQLLDAMVELGASRPSQDPAVRAAFLLGNDLAVILLRDQIAAEVGDDPLASAGLDRWVREVTAVYIEGTFLAPSKQPRS